MNGGAALTNGYAMPASAPVKALLFDLGRVVIDIDPARVFSYWARCGGPDASTLARRFVIDEAYRANERGETDMATYFAHLRRSLGLGNLSEHELLDGWNQTFIGPVAGIEDLLDGLVGALPMHALSNTNAAHGHYMRQHMAALLARFDDVHLSHELGARKPEPDAFARVVRKIGQPAGNILFFDDLPENVEAARRAGLQTIRVRGIADTLKGLAQIRR